ncbi:hypothetical protein KV557_30270 [Kitasatospora aureofaciens]|uniref:hypothetical protein n=1 Tax=Kitasatospora aureofaciens TaxID=1894 RepID=UPI001C44AA0E|nr:hypothetical protein [Kitasatospora aureofaciens]MBV6701349.1 hypothetical protein [Kitasatospora aureofaciens]
MTEQSPHGAPPPPAGQPYGAAPVPPQTPPPGYPAPAQAPGYPAPDQAGYPGYDQAGGYPAYGMYAPPPPPRKSHKTLWIVLGVVFGVLVLGGGALAYFVFDLTSNAGTQKIVMPATFKDLKKNDDPATTQKIEDELTAEIGKGDGNWKPTGVAGVYQDAQSEPQLVAVGVYGKVLLPKQELDQMFTGFTSSGPKLDSRHAVDAGPKGGTMECANATDSDTKMGICAWADNSSVVMVLKVATDDTPPDLDKLAADARDLRAVAEVAK